MTLLTKLLVTAALVASLGAHAQPMLTQADSPHNFADTVQRLEKAIEARGLVMFAKIDHAEAAQKAGLTLRPTQLLIFGNPKSGTPLMQAIPTVAVDLPLKALVWQADDGKVRVAVNAADLYKRHGLSDEQAKPLAGVAGLVEAALK
jgi:uncharacterized protein (DUF302 family)